MSLVEDALHLSGLCPAAASVAAIALGRDAEEAVALDPAALLFLAQHDIRPPLVSDPVLLTLQAILEQPHMPFVDWTAPGVDRVWRASRRYGRLAATIALAPGVGVDPFAALTAASLAPLGWLAVCALEPGRIGEYLNRADDGWQASAWGMNHAPLTRRLTRRWRFPAWLADCLGNLDRDLPLAIRIGADARLAAVVQLAVHLVESAGLGLNLVVGARRPDLESFLQWSDASAVDRLADDAPLPAFDDPRRQPYLADVLRLTIENRTRRDQAWIEQLHDEIDRLQSALSRQIADEERRLSRQKLTALAEFAGGAGHEINNPLAVISGQAQYVLKQLQRGDEMLLEDPTAAELLEALKAKLIRPLQTIVGQSQRIHHVITDLMQFARPQPPRPGVASVAKLVAEAAAAVRPLADERRVRLVCPEPPGNMALRIDAGQIRLALVNLLRNAVEAAPADGWASLRVDRQSVGDVALIVEDNGPGIAEEHRDHLFDPFYSGRSAGRGRGLGLSTAWRLARQNGGDVVFQAAAGVTRFALLLPNSALLDHDAPAAVGKRESTGYHLSVIG